MQDSKERVFPGAIMVIENVEKLGYMHKIPREKVFSGAIMADLGICFMSSGRIGERELIKQLPLSRCCFQSSGF